MKIKPVRIILILILGIAISSCTLGDKSVKIIKLDCDIYLKVVRWPTDTQRTYISDNSILKDTLNEPYYKALDFFYKIDNCSLIILKADTLNRSQLKNPKINIRHEWAKKVDFKNYDSLGFDNIIYQ